MFCSRRAGSSSINVACDKPTNAPDAGLKMTSATKSDQKPRLVAVSAQANAKHAPPAKMSARRRRVSLSKLSTGSTVLPKSIGTVSSSPTCA